MKQRVIILSGESTAKRMQMTCPCAILSGPANKQSNKTNKSNAQELKKIQKSQQKEAANAAYKAAWKPKVTTTEERTFWGKLSDQYLNPNGLVRTLNRWKDNPLEAPRDLIDYVDKPRQWAIQAVTSAPVREVAHYIPGASTVVNLAENVGTKSLARMSTSDLPGLIKAGSTALSETGVSVPVPESAAEIINQGKNLYDQGRQAVDQVNRSIPQITDQGRQAVDMISRAPADISSRVKNTLSTWTPDYLQSTVAQFLPGPARSQNPATANTPAGQTIPGTARNEEQKSEADNMADNAEIIKLRAENAQLTRKLEGLAEQIQAEKNRALILEQKNNELLTDNQTMANYIRDAEERK